MKLTVEIMYNALIDKDPAFEGLFIAAVKTTGIFCRPTCNARKPKKENVEFFETAREAIQNGYRPCKVCTPLDLPGQTPQIIKKLIDEVNADETITIRDYELRKRGIEPESIRRWFKKNHGITFQAFQRMLRINSAFKKLQTGESVSSVAYDSGYDSLSGFNDSFKSITGINPSGAMNKTVINIHRFETPLGPVFTCATEKGICLLEFTDRRMLETELKSLTKLLDAKIIHGHNVHFEKVEKQINEYFKKERSEFSVPLHTPGSDFQQRVWNELKNIPYGSTRSYKQHAIALDQPSAVRAVANANGMNRIAIIIPCHRVIGEDGHLTGYGGGIWRKKWLLDLERGVSPGNKSVQQEIIFNEAKN